MKWECMMQSMIKMTSSSLQISVTTNQMTQCSILWWKIMNMSRMTISIELSKVKYLLVNQSFWRPWGNPWDNQCVTVETIRASTLKIAYSKFLLFKMRWKKSKMIETRIRSAWMTKTNGILTKLKKGRPWGHRWRVDHLWIPLETSSPAKEMSSQGKAATKESTSTIAELTLN